MENGNKPLNSASSNRRRAREELTERVEGLAQQILDHIADNPHPLPPARAVRGRNSERTRTGRNSGRSVSFSNICGCPGTACSSGPEARHPPAYSELNPSAQSFTPARQDSRNTARRYNPREGHLLVCVAQGCTVLIPTGQIISRLWS